MRLPKPAVYSVLSATLALAVVSSGCQPAADTNANLTTNANTTLTTNANTATTAAPGGTIEAREPERYRATMVMTAQTTGGERAAAIPQITAQVARDGANRRLQFELPNNQVVFLSRGETHYVILPTQRQYFTVTPETTGMSAQVMTPGQIVDYARNQQGVERVGESEINGRPAVQYRYRDARQTGTQAGEVQSETFIYVDRELGLPVRTELRMQATGQVQGQSAATVVVEMRDISTDVEANTFELPQGYREITAEQVRQQVSAVIAVLSQVAGAMMRQPGGAQPPATGATPAATPPAAAATP